jgi:hypothetical protein
MGSLPRRQRGTGAVPRPRGDDAGWVGSPVFVDGVDPIQPGGEQPFVGAVVAIVHHAGHRQSRTRPGQPVALASEGRIGAEGHHLEVADLAMGLQQLPGQVLGYGRLGDSGVPVDHPGQRPRRDAGRLPLGAIRSAGGHGSVGDRPVGGEGAGDGVGSVGELA